MISNKSGVLGDITWNSGEVYDIISLWTVLYELRKKHEVTICAISYMLYFSEEMDIISGCSEQNLLNFPITSGKEGKSNTRITV